jgi:hypothetical protein
VLTFQLRLKSGDSNSSFTERQLCIAGMTREGQMAQNSVKHSGRHFDPIVELWQ